MDVPSGDAEALVRGLYEVGQPKEVIEQIAEQLRQMQLSPSGWQMADNLLRNSDPNIRFFAANTFTIKLNADGSTLGSEDVVAILDKLIAAFVAAVDSGDAARVLQKLCVAMATLFFLPNSEWKHCVRHVFFSLHFHGCVAESQVSDHELESGFLQSKQQFTALLLFATTLAEDAQKIDHNVQRHAHVNVKMKNILTDALRAVALALDEIKSSDTFEEDSALEVLDCFQAWAGYCISEVKAETELIDQVKFTLGSIMSMLSQPSLFVSTAVFLRSILSEQDYTGLLSDEHAVHLRNLLFSETAQDRYQALAGGSDEVDDVAFGELTFAFGYHCVTTSSLTETPDDPIMGLILGLSRAISHDTFDETLADCAVDFWECYATHLPELDDASAIDASARHWMLAILTMCQASRVPSGDQTLDASEVDESFMEFRGRVTDMIHDTYDILGPATLTQLFEMLRDVQVPAAGQPIPAAESGSTDNIWSNLWACLHPLEDMYEMVVEYRAFVGSDDLLAHIFHSSQVTFLLDNFDATPLPLQKTLLHLLGEYSNFIGRDAALMGNILNTLVSRVRTSWLIAKAVAQLCEGNRRRLTDRLPDFMSLLGFLVNSDVPKVEASYLIKAVAAIVQALPDDQAKIPHLLDLIQCVKHIHAKEVAKIKAEDQNASGSEAAIVAVDLMKDIASALITPADVLIDLEGEEAASESDIWTEGSGNVVQSASLELIEQLISPHPNNGELLSATCDFLTQGFLEGKSGPFVFSPRLLSHFVLSASKQNPRLEVVISMSSRLISSYVWRKGVEAELERDLFSGIVDIMTMYDNPELEPELAQRLLEFFDRALTRQDSTLASKSHEVLEQIIRFASATLQTANPLPKAAAARFFAGLMSLAPEHGSAQVTEMQDSIGGHLTSLIIFQIGGLAARSSLTSLTDALKALVVGRVKARAWLEAALHHQGFPSDKATAAQKNAFMHQVISLQGGRRTSRAVGDFYAICRGTPATYG